jgi:hypothetical protein
MFKDFALKCLLMPTWGSNETDACGISTISARNLSAVHFSCLFVHEICTVSTAYLTVQTAGWRQSGRVSFGGRSRLVREVPSCGVRNIRADASFGAWSNLCAGNAACFPPDISSLHCCRARCNIPVFAHYLMTKSSILRAHARRGMRQLDRSQRSACATN